MAPRPLLTRVSRELAGGHCGENSSGHPVFRGSGIEGNKDGILLRKSLLVRREFWEVEVVRATAVRFLDLKSQKVSRLAVFVKGCKNSKTQSAKCTCGHPNCR